MSAEQFQSASCSHKRKRSDCQYDDDDDDEQVKEEDEEDDDDGISEVKQKNVLKQVLQAQERTTIKEYDGIKITPFNLEEECEEGEYDKSGNFIFHNKNKNDLNNKSDNDDDDEQDDDEDEETEHDTWADSINWLAVEREEQEKKERELIEGQRPINKKFKDNNEQTAQRTKLDCYKHMLRILRPDETVQKSLRRLGNIVPKRRPNQTVKKISSQQTPMDTTASSEEIAEAKRKLDLLIELAHQLVEEGDTDIYQKSYEQLEDLIN